MKFENSIQAEFVSINRENLINRTKNLDLLENELATIKENLCVIDEKRRMLANLSKLYS
jgi:hypothetical protein